jgi:hypothetical protein
VSNLSLGKPQEKERCLIETPETFLNGNLASPSDCVVIWNERTKWLLNLNTKSVAEIEKERTCRSTDTPH